MVISEQAPGAAAGPGAAGGAAPISAAQALRAAYARAGRPWSAHIDLTYRCDLDCQHCYLDDRKTWPELTTAEWLGTLDQLAQLGVLQLSWSGGELLLRKDLSELLARARALGFVSSLRSHLGLMTPAIARQWRDAGVEKVRTSVYSLDPARHDAFTRRPGSLHATLAGLQQLVDVGVSAGADVVLQAATIEEIPEMVAFFAARGVKVEFSTSIFRDHRAERHLDLLDLTSAQRVRARELIFAHHKPFADVHAPAAAQPEEGPCSAGRGYFYIAPDGAVWPCVMFPMALGHLREHSLQEIWELSPQRQALAQWKNKHRGTCLTCAGSEVCFYCPGEAYKHTGDFRNPPEHFHGRARDMMQALERVHGPRYSADQWASVPAGGERRERPSRFVFPIYRPSRGSGARVTPVRQP